MSAELLDHRHINYLVTFATTYDHAPMPTYYWKGERHNIHMRRDEVGQILWDENYRSVNHRYNEDNGAPEFHTRPLKSPDKFDPVQALKAANGYVYQSCESPDYYETEAHAIIQVIKAKAIRNLPGYEEAEWVMRDREPAPTLAGL